MQQSVPEWLPDWLREALSQPTMSVPDAGLAVFKAGKFQSYELARQNVIPTVRSARRKEVPTIWVRRQLMLDEGPAAALPGETENERSAAE